MASLRVDPLTADLLARLAAHLQDEFIDRIDRLEFETEFPNRLLICLGLLEVLRRELLPTD